MSKLPKRAGWTASDYAEFRDRCTQSHSVRWSANAYRRSSGGGVDTLMTDIPVTGGTLTLDSSNPLRRTLEMEVGGGDALTPRTYLDPLVPFGQWLVLWVQVDRQDGTWFPKLKSGEYHITSYSYERPSLIATVEAVDWAGRVDEFLHLGKTHYKGTNVGAAIQRMVDAALPKVYGTDMGPGSKQHIKNYVADAGRGRWEVATELAEIKGVEAFFDSNGDLVVRDAVTGYYDNVVPGNGPDIGTVADPVEVIAEGSNLVAMTATLTREGGCNYVRYNLAGTITRKDKKQIHKGKGSAGVETHQGDWTANVDAEQNKGPVAYGDIFGKLPIVEDRAVHRVGWSGSDERANYHRAAEARLHRRLGIVRYLDLDMVGGYQLEPDDKVKLRWVIENADGTHSTREEDHYVQSVSFDLGGRSATRIRTRSLAVTDPGA